MKRFSIRGLEFRVQAGLCLKAGITSTERLPDYRKLKHYKT